MSGGRACYVLDEQRRPIPEPDALAWSEWCFGPGNDEHRRVARTCIEAAGRDKPVLVSTVFLGIDHGFGGEGREPVLFETMVFEGDDVGEDWPVWRWRTWDEAADGHAAAVRLVTAKLGEPL